MKITSFRRPLLSVLVGGALVASLVACGSDDDDEPSSGPSAASAGTLTVYSGRSEDLVQPLIDAFSESTGIDVDVRYDGSAALAATLLEEGDATPADVFFSQDAGALGALENADLFEPIDAAQLAKVPPAYSSDAGRWVGLSGRARVLVYNPDQVTPDQLPDSVLDLTQPAYKGKVAFAPGNASWQAFVTALRVTQGEAETKAFLEAFKANEPREYEGNSPIVDAVNNGEIAYGLVNHYYLYEKAAASEGGLADYTARNHAFEAGDPGNLLNVAGVGVLKGKTSPQTSAFVEFMLGTEAQTAFAEQTFEYPLVTGITATVEGAPPLSEVEGPDVDLTDLDTLEATQALLREVGLLS